MPLKAHYLGNELSDPKEKQFSCPGSKNHNFVEVPGNICVSLFAQSMFRHVCACGSYAENYAINMGGSCRRE